MTTIRQIERLWRSGQFDRMLRLCLEMRQEASVRLAIELARARAIPAAAMAVIRLDELGQPHAPLCAEMIRAILAAQEADGGWADPMTTALCIRALMCSNGQGQAILQGIGYLAGLQKAEGIWPKVPIRRMPADPFVSAFILFQLAQDGRFAQTVRLTAALRWFRDHESRLDTETARLWRSISCRHAAAAPAPHPAPVWS
jgi:hypothetical protein